MSKHKDKRLKIRRKWNINPVTSVRHSRKAYDRNEIKRDTLKTFEEEIEDMNEY